MTHGSKLWLVKMMRLCDPELVTLLDTSRMSSYICTISILFIFFFLLYSYAIFHCFCNSNALLVIQRRSDEMSISVCIHDIPFDKYDTRKQTAPC